MDRRAFLIGCSLAASPLVTPVSFAAAPGDGRLVVVILRGAMDGLDILQPYGDPVLAGLRPSFEIGPAAGNPDLDGFHALHRSLAPLTSWWTGGDLAFAQAVSTPYRGKRSHFDGQDLLEAGTPGLLPLSQRDGWLNRLVGVVPGAHGRTAFAIGRENMKILRGEAAHSRWAPDARLELSAATADLLRHVYHDDSLFRRSAQEALILSAEDPGSADLKPHEALFDFAATQLRADARIAALSIGGWDTHQSQAARIRQPLERLATGLAALRQGLGPYWDRTAVLAVTEFGRTVRENGTKGTDHGTGGTLLLAGGAIRGGRVLGAYPGLAESDLLDGRDVMPMRDVRAYAAWAMAGLFGLGRYELETTVFPGLEMGEDPNVLA
ncbi:DUF1501 domain-containing protein [Jannaschia aquimarina]|uniref:DUF1501 domain-containing protein n=1 Tax=Jannaschia aquimarina TaxID=935700 RepID=A0A0D1DBV2_9RHOB|nr:DUF1501 domain-containing protein [Jannaschia aquimarina]KIT17478.1 hypothetical protein jaqu_06660 [Jannaschia aquimarina]SNS75014.1 Uncharacterized conserved protein, DUF1501 family [Jannaschia aquimarina]